ncbi:MAG: ATP-binding protein [Anaerolineae bacterium]|nr:ATP-binding protein [Anaerolineae bacterium]
MSSCPPRLNPVNHESEPYCVSSDNLGFRKTSQPAQHKIDKEASIYFASAIAAPPPRNPYHNDYFVGRQDELRGISLKVEQGLAGHAITNPVIHVWGAPGIGKSWLLRHVLQKYTPATPPQATIAQKTTLAVLVDCAVQHSTLKDLLEVALENFERSLASDNADLSQRETENHTTPSISHFVATAKALSERFVLLFLFDAVEKLSSDGFSQLEREIIAPLASTERIIFIIASRKELPRWKEFSVRQRLEVWELKSFDASTTQEQLARFHLPEGAWREIYRYTCGHPSANQVWSQAWCRGAPSEEENLVLLERVEREFFKDTMLERERDVLRTLSAPRKFNVELTRQLLGAIIDSEFKELSDGYYLRLFEALEQTNLVYWSSELRGYTMSLSVRRILDLRIQKGAPQLFQERHQLLQEYYERWAVKNPFDRGALVLEALYHLARGLANATSRTLRTRVEQFLRHQLNTEELTTDDADTFLHLLNADPEFTEAAPALPPTLCEIIQNEAERLLDQVSNKISM